MTNLLAQHVTFLATWVLRHFPWWPFLLFAVLLAGCTDPKAFRIEGPKVAQGYGDRQLIMTVYNFDPTKSLNWERLKANADLAVDGHGIVGGNSVSFFDGLSRQLIVKIGYMVTFDEIMMHPKYTTSCMYGNKYEEYSGRLRF